MNKTPEIIFNKEFETEMKILLNDEFSLFKESYAKERVKSIRINPAKFKEQHLHWLKLFNLKDTGLNNDTYFVDVTQPLGQFPYYHGGLYYPQEVSASAVVTHMGLKSDDWVLDLCAAPGGKSTQILSVIKDGFLLSNEINTRRLPALVENSHRFGASNMAISNNDCSDLPSNGFDHVLLDAPCTGESMIKRFPELVNQYSVNSILKAQKLQLKLFEDAIDKVKDGGRITYSTCTFNRYENEFVIKEMLERYPTLELVDLQPNQFCVKGVEGIGLRYYPHLFGEGHFVAQVIVHKENQKQNLVVTQKDYQIGVCHYQIETHHPLLKNLKLVSIGKPLLENNKPHWASPLSIGTQVDIELTMDEAYLYLNGQVLPDKTMSKGYQVVGIDSLPLGWVKATNGQLKNHYPKKFRNRFQTMKKSPK